MKLLRIFAVSEIIGGVLVLLNIPLALAFTGIPIWYNLLTTVLGLYAIVAGTLLWQRTVLGQWLSLVLQAIQLIQIATSGLIIKILVGFHLSVFMPQSGGFSITPGMNGSFGVWGMGHTERLGLGINLLALVSLIFLMKCLTVRAVVPPKIIVTR